MKEFKTDKRFDVVNGVVVCVRCGEKLIPDGSGCSSTYIGYIEVDCHLHDDNCIKRNFKCKNGHRVALSKQRRCSKCDWKGQTECFCCGQKVENWPDDK